MTTATTDYINTIPASIAPLILTVMFVAIILTALSYAFDKANKPTELIGWKLDSKPEEEKKIQSYKDYAEERREIEWMMNHPILNRIMK